MFKGDVEAVIIYQDNTKENSRFVKTKKLGLKVDAIPHWKPFSETAECRTRKLRLRVP